MPRINRDNLAHSRTAFRDFVRRGLAFRMSVSALAEQFSVAPGTMRCWIEKDFPDLAPEYWPCSASINRSIQEAQRRAERRGMPASVVEMLRLPDPEDVASGKVDAWDPEEPPMPQEEARLRRW